MTTTQDKTRHTSGPWQAITAEDWDGATVQTQGGRIVACCDGCDIPGATMEPTTEEAKANAHLIAAAPELLQVARDYVLLCQLHDIEGAVLDSAIAAIAKAEGGDA